MTTKKERREKKLKTRENKREKKRENERENEVRKSSLEKSRPKKDHRDQPPPPGSADVFYFWDEHEEGDELLAVTLTPLNAAARMSIMFREPISGLHPDDPGNLLDNPDIAGPAVGEWVRKLYRYHTGLELVPRGRGPDRVPKTGPRAESVRRRLLAPLEKLKALLESKGDSTPI